MQVTKKIKGEYIVFGISGSLDMNNVKFIKKIFDDATDNGVTAVAIDMKELTYIDSSGIGSFIGLMTKLKGMGGQVVLMNMNEDIKRIFAMTKLLAFFKVFNTEEEFNQSVDESTRAPDATGEGGGMVPPTEPSGTPTGGSAPPAPSTPPSSPAGESPGFDNM